MVVMVKQGGPGSEGRQWQGAGCGWHSTNVGWDRCRKEYGKEGRQKGVGCGCYGEEVGFQLKMKGLEGHRRVV